ncbi:hypothetical protein, partial [Streptomyces mesophilus]|uniref:hypothetical protein n=1 Tax=Streptomyces mesophilus TaxID=1775132 RepID=UPI0033208B5F
PTPSRRRWGPSRPSPPRRRGACKRCGRGAEEVSVQDEPSVEDALPVRKDALPVRKDAPSVQDDVSVQPDVTLSGAER